MKRQLNFLRPKLATFVLVLVPFLAFESHADDWSYTIRPGDDLWTIARDYCGSAKVAPRIAEHNKIGNVYTLKIGSRITIPTDWLVFAPTTARITQLQGQVTHQTQDGSRPATSNSEINMGDIVITQTGSAQVTFADQSTITIQPDSRVLFNKLTAFGPAGMVDTHLRFAYGNGTSKVQPQNRGDRFRIETPEGIAAVRGTEFRVGYEQDSSIANAETLEGEIAFIGFREVDVPQGFGIAATQGGITKENLLDAPGLTSTAEEIFAGEPVEWQPVVDADHYVVSWSDQAQPDTTTKLEKKPEPITLANVEPGSYQFSVRAVSASGIQGYDASQAIIVKEIPPIPDTPQALDVSKDGRELTLTWDAVNDVDRYRIKITRQDYTHTIETTETKAIYILPQTGTYTIAVAAERSAQLSEPAETEVRHQRPWWLLFLVFPLLAL